MELQDFIGIWDLVREETQYGMGEIPQKGRYVIDLEGPKVKMDVSWTDHEGRDFKLDFSLIPDGTDQPFSDPSLADSMRMRFDPEGILESWSSKHGYELVHVRRVLRKGGRQMEVTQAFNMPGGPQVKNVSLYQKAL